MHGQLRLAARALLSGRPSSRRKGVLRLLLALALVAGVHFSICRQAVVLAFTAVAAAAEVRPVAVVVAVAQAAQQAV